MKNGLKFFTSILLASMLSVQPGYCLEQKYEFGKIPIDQNVEALPSWAIDENCTNSEEGFDDCQFFDNRGVQYFVFNGILSAKEFVVGDKNKNSLPYGMNYSLSRDRFVEVLSRKLNLNFVKATDFRENGYLYRSESISPEKYDGMVILVIFDTDGKLHSVKVTSDYT